MEPGGTVTFCVYYIQGDQKKLFLSFAKKVLCCFKLQYTLFLPQGDLVPGASSHLYEKHFLMCWTYLGRLLHFFIISSL